MKNKIFSFLKRNKEIIKIHFLIISMIIILCSVFVLTVLKVSEKDLHGKTEVACKLENAARSYTYAGKTENQS